MNEESMVLGMLSFSIIGLWATYSSGNILIPITMTIFMGFEFILYLMLKMENETFV